MATENTVTGRVLEIEGLLHELERRMRPLAWDASRNQINEFRRQQLGKLQKEHAQLSEELKQLLHPESALPPSPESP